MQVWVWIWMVVVLKIPVIAVGWILWHAIGQTGEQVIGGGEGGEGGVRYEPGPRTRGPHDPRFETVPHRDPLRHARRRDPGHNRQKIKSTTPRNVSASE
ncbi:MAG: hypothetical protein HY827_00580 [Actinobacteria bacterium]|nr:hypothetical protein [Actinomycetota bacterium]